MNESTKSFLLARDLLQKHRINYQAGCAEFEWPEFSHFNWALDYFDLIASPNSRALSIVQDDGSQENFTFSQLSVRSNQVANWLKALGVNRGDRVLLMLGNQKELWESMLALMKLGAVLIPTTTLLDQNDMQDRVDRGHVRHVICNPDAIARLNKVTGDFTRILIGKEENWHSFSESNKESAVFNPDTPTQATDPLLLYFTSGTTSKPKMVLHSHQSYPVGHLSTMFWTGLRSDDVHLNISSPGWGKHAWSSFFAPWNAGACIFVYNYSRFKSVDLLNVLVEHGVTSLCAPPTVWRMLIQETLSNWPVKLRGVLGAGEPLNPEVIEQVKNAWGLTIRDGFGQTETTCAIGNSPGETIKFGSMGKPMPGYPVVLLDVEGQVSDEGEICFDLSKRPMGLMDSYFGDVEKTADAMRDGFYHTCDVASRDKDGYITYVGRSDDVFKSSDYRLSPFELESVLMTHPDIAETAVIPSPDSKRLNVPKAFIVLRSGVLPDRNVALSILRFAGEHLAPYKRVRRIEFAELPKTISGKIRRSELRTLENEKIKTNVRDANEYWEEDFPDLLT